MADETDIPEDENERPAPIPEQGVSPITIEEEMKRSYLDYAMSVIVSRAIPDVRDGLKPVHRRILYSMHENGFTREKAYRKSARVVGDVIGKYHPHGDTAVYDALVRMAQDFSMRLPLLDGQGNFGSVDGDPPAAMRYTEVRMDRPAASLLADIEKNTVNFQDNYDASEREPVVLPARYPNILVNGAGGIAVGMATNIAPHNLGEVIDATLALMENGQLSDDELLEIIPGPDFPTGGQIMGRSGARQGVLTGRGSVTVRAVTTVEEIRKDRFAIVTTELPYQVNKANLQKKIVSLVNDKKVEGVAAVRDESDRVGMRLVVELKRDAVPDVVLNQLFRYTPMQQQAKAILDLRLLKLTQLGMDEITEEAEKLAATITDLLDILRSRARVQAIISAELTEIKEKYETPRRSEFVAGGMDFDDEDLIAVEDMVVTVTAAGYVKRTPLDTYRAQRRGGKGRSGMSMKDEDYVTTVFVATTHTPVLFFSSTGMAYKLKVWKLPPGGPNTRGKALVNLLPLEQGETVNSIMALPEDEESWGDLDIMFASRSGGVRRNSLSDFTRVNRNGKIAMKPDEGDGIVDVRVVTEDDDLMLTTAKGKSIRFRTTDVRRFVGRTSSGVRGIKLAEGDEVISMAVLRHVDIETDEARAYMKHANAMRRALSGEENTEETDDVDVETSIDPERLGFLQANEQFLLTLADDGLGKRSSSYDYRCMNRGGQGVTAQNLERGKNSEDAQLVRSMSIEEDNQLMIVTDGGQLIRCPVRNISIVSRSARGVTVIRVKDGEKVVSVGRIEETEEEDAPNEEGSGSEGSAEA